ncbi:AAA family ATPase [Nostoc sp. UIC 10607]|uniref:AAA family ATPase n=1 Tax=Nostoc sp. UIC 10607 TaxID=3045935 RepID=UPI0039A10D6A
MNQKKIEYTGKIHPPKGGELNEQLRRKLYAYYPSDSLKEAVNLAIKLHRPLLLEGEPGCGKSELARAVFYELSKQYTSYEWDYRLWNVQSTSKAQDGFYSYDYIGRLQAAQLAKVEIKDKQSNPANPEDYLELGPLGYAFDRDFLNQKKSEKPYRTIVLIDEIDKADTDFPNDLLLALEDKCFEIKDLRPRQWLKANPDAPPIVFITSNQEKELPNAFLRRCLYHYIEFPDNKDELKKIIQARFQSQRHDLVDKAIERFLELRSEMNDEKEETAKKVSTSELIDWFTVLNDYPPEKVIKKLEDERYPFASTLLKSRQDKSEYGF